MAYRNDVDALQARLAAIQGDLDATTRQRDEAARLLAEARARAAAEGLAADWAAGGPQRRRRRRVKIALAATALVALGSGVTYKLTRSDRGQDVDQLIARFGVFEAQMCLCHDRACAEAVSAQMTTWSVEITRTQPKPFELDESQRAQVTRMAQHFGQCTSDAMRELPKID